MKDVKLTITLNEKVSKDIFLMKLEGDVSEVKNCGEFINITLPPHYLRRPISVSNFGPGYIEILYKVLGQGTKEMSLMTAGQSLKCLVGLGNGFNLRTDIKPTLIAGGIGVAPFFAVLKYYNEKGIKPQMIYGARSKDDLVLLDKLAEMSDLHLCTDDGSCGVKGTVLDLIKEENLSVDYYYACGPYRMLENLAKSYPNGEVSLEARMGCGFGACMGCSIKTTKGPKRVCKEGPVFAASEVEF
ncbi:MAG: dihydroorotate dehydrogenase electron transfer subunit [Acholeplasmatales bacterium]|nr:dihydroorotate dehydrogenase electron transfer subunit [Acholeplasmatales bacterium]